MYNVLCTIFGGEPLIRLARCRRPPSTANQTKEKKQKKRNTFAQNVPCGVPFFRSLHAGWRGKPSFWGPITDPVMPSGTPRNTTAHLTQNMLWAFSLLLQLQSCHSVHCMVNLLATFVAVDRYYLLWTKATTFKRSPLVRRLAQQTHYLNTDISAGVINPVLWGLCQNFVRLLHMALPHV